MKKVSESQSNFQKELRQITSSLSIHHPLEKISARSLMSVFYLKKPKVYKYHDSQHARSQQLKNVRVQLRKNDILKYKFQSQEFQRMFLSNKEEKTSDQLNLQISSLREVSGPNNQTGEVAKVSARKKLSIRSLSPALLIASQEQVMDQIARKTFTVASEIQNDVEKSQIKTPNSKISMNSKFFTCRSQYSHRLYTEISNRQQTVQTVQTSPNAFQKDLLKCSKVDIKIKNEQKRTQNRWSAGYIQKLQLKAEKITENSAKVHEQNKNNYKIQIAQFQRYKNTEV